MKSFRYLKFVFLLAMLTVMSAVSVTAACKHSYPPQGWVTVKAATCTADGKEERACIKCGKKQIRTIKKTSHNWVTQREESTCVKKGKEWKVCKKCKTKMSISKALPLKAHRYGAWKTIKKPTCTSRGEQKRVCFVCGKGETKSVSKIDHVWTGYRATTISEKKKYGWSSIWFCSKCNTARGSLANY